MSNCSCGCSPCKCPTQQECEGSECTDPGIIKEGSFALVLKNDMCDRRLATFRGFDEDGEPETNPNIDPIPGVYAQMVDDDGNVTVGWTDAPCNNPSSQIIRVENDEQGADAANYIERLIGKGAGNCEIGLKGSDDAASGQWDMIWDSASQKWTTVPRSEVEEVCTVLTASVVLDPSDTDGFLISVESTSMFAVGITIKVGVHELLVTEIVSSVYLRVEVISTLASPVTIQSGTVVCGVGYRPCPVRDEPYADEMVGCFEGVPVSLEVPANVNSVPVPGFAWRNQLGKYAFLNAPVDPTSGLIVPNLYLKTPASPAGSAANIPGFSALSLPGWTFLGTPTSIFTQNSPGLPINVTTPVNLNGTAGWVPGATAVLLSIDMYGIVTSADYHVYLKINGITRGHILLVAAFGSQAEANQCLVAVPADYQLDIQVLVAVGTVGVSNGFNCTVSVDGYFHP